MPIIPALSTTKPHGHSSGSPTNTIAIPAMDKCDANGRPWLACLSTTHTSFPTHSLFHLHAKQDSQRRSDWLDRQRCLPGSLGKGGLARWRPFKVDEPPFPPPGAVAGMKLSAEVPPTPTGTGGSIDATSRCKWPFSERRRQASRPASATLCSGGQDGRIGCDLLHAGGRHKRKPPPIVTGRLPLSMSLPSSCSLATHPSRHYCTKALQTRGCGESLLEINNTSGRVVPV